MAFNLTKTEDTNGTLWKRLMSNNQKKTPIWFDMRNTYKEDMEDYAKILDQEDDEREKVHFI